MTFGDKMIKLRKQLGLTQRQLANRVGVSVRTITNYETGGRLPKQKETYYQLADALEVDASYLRPEMDQHLFNAEQLVGDDAEKEAIRVVAKVSGLFTGGRLEDVDQEELMLAFQEAYWVASEIAESQDKDEDENSEKN